ncbi:hypothetical protein ACFQ1M_09020 [Sungkyunkwania multivorans]|uniref:Uncharacterized protein n=1 Tax=Sungkyunkwania multivorans TaxID=1173618 RepID=A0ABW3D076_9FLAO
MSKEKSHNADKKDGFKVPQGYFETFGDALFDKLNSSEISLPKDDGMSVPSGYFENMNEQLDEKMLTEKLPAKEGMRVPDGYFSSFEERLFDKLNQDKASSTKVVKLHSYKKYYYAISGVAAAILLFVAIKFAFPGASDLEKQWAQIENEDIEKYIATGTTLNSYEIAEVFGTETLDYAEIIEEEYSDEEVIEFINNNIESVDDYLYETSQTN